MSWKKVRGHDSLVRAFEEVIRRGRLGHAYLFVGPRGVGKRLFAFELAKALLCEADGDHLEACDRCPGCLQVEAGTHPDFVVAGRPEESLEVPIQTVREVCRSFGLKAVRGRGKVAILDDADDLNDAAANCFLKTLEEPPPRSVLLLIGTSPERQLPTILSRCQIVHFPPLEDKLVAELLRGQGVEDPAMIERLVSMSHGSVGEATALADPALWEFRSQLLESLAQPRPDSVAIGKRWTEFVEEAGTESSAQRRQAALALRLLIEFLNNVLACSVGKIPDAAPPGERKLLQELADRLGTDRILQLLERCLQADLHIERRVQLVLILEALGDALGRQATAVPP